MSDPMILILGGTTEAYALARLLVQRGGVRVMSSLAGRTSSPRLPDGEVRIGGFGGPEGLARYLHDHDVLAVVDATHPFARQMGWNAAAGCAAAHVPLLRLERPAWQPSPGDQWEEIDDWAEAVGIVGSSARRVLMAVGRQELEPFAELDHVWFLVRSVDLPDPMPSFAQMQMLLARGPFPQDNERALLLDHQIDTIVCKNSGGSATDGKLAAARDLGLKVVMKRRPPRPDLPQVESVEQAAAWVERQIRRPDL